MADRYWVGGSAAWDGTAGTKWALTSGGAGGQAVPTAADDVYIDAGSGAVTVTVSATAVCQNISFTSGAGAFAGTFAGGSALTISGSLTIVPSVNWTFAGGALTFNATSAQTITTAGKVIQNAVTFNGVGGSWQLQDAFTMGATRQLNLTAGTLNMNSQTLTTRNISSSNSNVRRIEFGTADMVLTGSALTAIAMNDATNFTYSGTGAFNLTAAASTGTRTCRFGNTAGGSITNSPNLKISAGTDALSLSPGQWNTVNHTGFAGTVSAYAYFCYGDWVCPSGVTFTGSTNPLIFAAVSSKTIQTGGVTIDSPVTFNGVNGDWTVQGALTLGAGRALTLAEGTLRLAASTTNTVGSLQTSGTSQKTLLSATPGLQATLSDASGVNTVTALTVQDIAATGGATWNAYIDQNNVNAGNNTGWNFGLSPTTLAYEVSYEIRSFTQPRRF